MKSCKSLSYIAVVNYIDYESFNIIGDQHAHNINYHEEHGYFVRFDQSEPYAQPIGLASMEWLKGILNMRIYHMEEVDTTEALYQKNKWGFCASRYY